jgi:putative transposase
MARLPRLFAPGIPAHVTVRGNNHQDIFCCDTDRSVFRSCLLEATQRFGLAIHAYVLMTNHVHVLATGAEPSSVPKAIQSVGRQYVGYFNGRYARSGTLWEGRYRSTLVEADRYLFACHRYIDQNPVRAAMVSFPSDYPWSSHRFYAFGDPDQLVTPHEVLSGIGASPENRCAAYRALFDEPLEPDILDQIRKCSFHGWALGGDRFCEALIACGARRPLPKKRKRGR